MAKSNDSWLWCVLIILVFLSVYKLNIEHTANGGWSVRMEANPDANTGCSCRSSKEPK